MLRELHRQRTWCTIKLLNKHSAASFFRNCYEKKISLCELDFSITWSQMHFLTIQPPTEQDNNTFVSVMPYIPFSSLPMVKLAYVQYCTSAAQMSLFISVNWFFFFSCWSSGILSERSYRWQSFEPCMSEKRLYFVLTLNWLDIAFSTWANFLTELWSWFPLHFLAFIINNDRFDQGTVLNTYLWGEHLCCNLLRLAPQEHSVGCSLWEYKIMGV